MTDANLLEKVFKLVSNFTLVGGGLWLIWGTVILAGALKDKNGPQLQQGIWQIVGGGLILVAAGWFGTQFDFSSLLK
ncbi:hypothetical protein ACTNBL_07335 [Enterococcus villorum]|uniref:Permease n=2 Tax=Enterococcus villorum TaxID=112904 RepID=A0A511J1S8_9ENTE|nr:hypothetical protein [Enterococcus villorum]EOH94632.1 hypothetical protein UAO_00022 [Enterococcus villorum ATCC 700913]EOW77007.1 hypothetical protein I591_02328 [Enterococcus villorum ATCC 700913]GEL91971.1 hypothetical protein EVI01_13080 [Enterococcus villorum]